MAKQFLLEVCGIKISDLDDTFFKNYVDQQFLNNSCGGWREFIYYGQCNSSPEDCWCFSSQQIYQAVQKPSDSFDEQLEINWSHQRRRPKQNGDGKGEEMWP